jgi:hypothetical protein
VDFLIDYQSLIGRYDWNFGINALKKLENRTVSRGL